MEYIAVKYLLHFHADHQKLTSKFHCRQPYGSGFLEVQVII